MFPISRNNKLKVKRLKSGNDLARPLVKNKLTNDNSDEKTTLPKPAGRPKQRQRAYHLLMMSKQQQRVLYITLYSCLSFAIAWTFVLQNCKTTRIERKSTLLPYTQHISNDDDDDYNNTHTITTTNYSDVDHDITWDITHGYSEWPVLVYNDSRGFTMIDAYIQLRGKVELFNLTYHDSDNRDNNSSSGDIEVIVNMVIELHARCETGLSRDFNKSEINKKLTCSYKNEEKSEIICNEFGIWSAFERNRQWSDDYPTSWEYPMFDYGYSTYYMNTKIYINVVKIDGKNTNNYNFEKYKKKHSMTFVYLTNTPWVTLTDWCMRGSLILITTCILVCWIYRLWSFRV